MNDPLDPAFPVATAIPEQACPDCGAALRRARAVVAMQAGDVGVCAECAGLLAVSSCRYHGAGDCCTKCPEHAATDGRSFPHPSERRGRRPLRVCPGCDEALPAEGWDAARHPYSCLCAKCIRGAEKAKGER